MSTREAGQVLEGRYRLVERVGEGGMGEVWRGVHEITGRDVALKFFLGNLGEKQRERMFREARATSRVTHPNVVEVLDAFPDEAGAPVIVMELLVGETLEDRIYDRGVLELDEAATILLQVTAALAAAHARGIAHRDVKPANIFLGQGGAGELQVKVVDFGVAKIVDDGVTTTAGTAIGTPAYMAPEQIRADPNVDHRADVWGVGVVTHEMLSGERPIEGSSIGALVENMLTHGVPSLAETLPEGPADLVAAVDAMTKRDVEERASDFFAFAAALSAILDRPPPSLPAASSIREPENDLQPSSRGATSASQGDVAMATTVRHDSGSLSATETEAAPDDDDEGTPPESGATPADDARAPVSYRPPVAGRSLWAIAVVAGVLSLVGTVFALKATFDEPTDGADAAPITTPPEPGAASAMPPPASAKPSSADADAAPEPPVSVGDGRGGGRAPLCAGAQLVAEGPATEPPRPRCPPSAYARTTSRGAAASSASEPRARAASTAAGPDPRSRWLGGEAPVLKVPPTWRCLCGTWGNACRHRRGPLCTVPAFAVGGRERDSSLRPTLGPGCEDRDGA